ncbi:MAG: L-seryl-tRNA(Sec) selenium transferase [Bacteroidetes bacterium RIFOXYA12_FULL_35_11]|nr:MAG: L-seryl-tRNA(Sec) selenium transferase [Bacteroidetes bacterium GWF2_35_48]OFY81126.1 MAG: L-seryl-tRNA(Sec) selenium transferase [Bacteroidetes bacterium RIFOXYA12_FULL_35_11]OFY95388.1 MAG: L-seryl-tRNA(Sec) selenium transferase [Bacteroidetes bacterium RIFOXYC12_FULL_35_7]HBX52063.1 L-seryl-tRNA(Sec) selenium transferase [Bacteroidales bacterium]
MNTIQEALKSLPAVDKLLRNSELAGLIQLYGKESITFAIRHALEFFREKIKNGNPSPSLDDLLLKVNEIVSLITKKSLRKVYNATGIVIHTNLGRAPFGKELLAEVFDVLSGYNNLEFNLQNGNRGSRNDHLSELLKFLTGAEDVLVVNNAAAAVMLCLNTFAKRKEVIVSRGELVEIGGSFRVPEIMAASDCIMKEVGTTNKTKIDDYRNAITSKIRMLFKAHKSNYVITGFTEDVELKDLCNLGKEAGIPVMYDQGSGLLRNINNSNFKNEPNIKDALATGVDLICFSGDKLLGGPQAGIIAGKKQYIDKLKKAPMLRALRVCKTTIALLETTCSYYIKENILFDKNSVHKLASKKPSEIDVLAYKLATLLSEKGLKCSVIDNEPQIGGGSLPDKYNQSRAVILTGNQSSNKEKSGYAEKMYYGLLNHSTPVLGILKKGTILFDALTLFDEDIEIVARAIIDIHNSFPQNKIIFKT